MYRTEYSETGIWTVLHLLVDGLCACCVFMLAHVVGVRLAVFLIIVYNVLAFMTQPFTGMWIDRLHRRPYMRVLWLGLLLSGGCLTFGAESAHSIWLSFLVMSLLGLGNSLFHVCGGKSVAVRTENNPRHLGLFVSSGAIGLVLGQQFSNAAAVIILSLSLLSLSVLQWRKTSLNKIEQTSDSVLNVTSKGAYGLLAVVVLIVFLRSFLGQTVPAWGLQIANLSIVMSVLAFLGKASGGWLGQKRGIGTALVSMLLLSGMCFLLSSAHWAFLLAMVLCINSTMPLTLYLANRCLPKREGLAFGLLAAVLPLGFALGTFFVGCAISDRLLHPLIATMLIETLVLIALKERNEKVLGMEVLMNILTNVPLNWLVIVSPYVHYSIPLQLILECFVVAIETGLYCFVLRERRTALTYAVVCNGTSYLVGLLMSFL